MIADLLHVLDTAMQPAGIGQPGEIYIAGVGVGIGYWGDDARTRAVFVSDNGPNRSVAIVHRTGDLGREVANGDVQFVGRADTRIKSRGPRIELGEIEVAVSRLPEIAWRIIDESPKNGNGKIDRQRVMIEMSAGR